MSTLANKVAVVTGGSSGIGLATAREFGRLGANVVITGRDDARLQAAADEIDGTVLAVKTDVSNLSDLDRLFAETAATFRKIDILFVNAGVAQFAPIGEVSEESFDALMDINFKGAYFTIQKALPLMNDQASIILNGSVNAHVGFANATVYSASKAAVHSLARTLAAELTQHGIRVNTLNIGPINTPLFGKLGLPDEALQGFAQAVGGRLPVGRFGEPEEVAKAAAFLASQESSFIIGSEITADGGMLINSL